MLLKRILSLSLAAGLAVGASANVFAWDGESELDTLNNKEIISNAAEMLSIRACAVIFLDEIRVITSSAVKSFCDQLSKQLEYFQDVSNLKSEFERLYESDEAFRDAVNKAWVIDVATGSKQHASVQDGINKRSSKIHKRSSKIHKRSSKIHKRSSKIHKRSSKIH